MNMTELVLMNFESRTNIMIGMIGAEYQATPILTVRGGLNFNQVPVDSVLPSTNIFLSTQDFTIRPKTP